MRETSNNSQLVHAGGGGGAVSQICVSSEERKGFSHRLSHTREAHEYWNGWPIPPPGDLPDPGIELACPILQADSLPAELPGKPRLCYAHGIQQLIELF